MLAELHFGILTDNPLVPEDLKDALEPYLNRQYNEDVTFLGNPDGS